MTTLSNDNEDLLSQVVTNDLLVRTIFDNLSAKQLEEVRPVSQLWSEIGAAVARHRVFFEPFLLIYDPRGFRLSTESTSGDRGGDRGGMDGKDKRRYLNNLIKSQGIYKSDREDSALLQLAHFCKEIMSTLPRVCILFTSSVTLTIKMTSKTFLPSSCNQLIICSKSGVVGQPSLSAKPFELEKYHFKLNAISGSFVVQRWGDFQVFLTSWKDAQSREPNLNDNEYPVKATLIFSTNVEENKRFNSWLNSSQTPIPMGGALVDKIILRGEEVSMLTVSFAGRSIKAASLILDTDTIGDAENKLNEFKRSLDFDPDDTSHHIRTIGYLFICAGRGVEHYQGHLNVESNLAHKVFPQILFSGVFGNGEYGWNCYNHPNRDQQFKSLSQTKLSLSYTTAIVLVQFNRQQLQ